MKRPEFIARQSACPDGALGWLIARVMAVETAAANRQALALLGLEPTDHVLEVGFGHGRTVELVATMVPRGFVAGLDLSERALRMARHRNRRSIEEGRVELKRGDSARIPYPEHRFEKVYSVHTVYFWADPRQHLREIRRVTKPGGRLVLGFTPRDDGATARFPASVYRFPTGAEVKELLEEIGFVRVEAVTARAVRASSCSLSPAGEAARRLKSDNHSYRPARVAAARR